MQPTLFPDPEPAPEPIDPEDLLTCQVCGHTDDFDCFDVMGADKDCVFCLACGSEIDSVYGHPVRLNWRRPTGATL